MCDYTFNVDTLVYKLRVKPPLPYLHNLYARYRSLAHETLKPSTINTALVYFQPTLLSCIHNLLLTLHPPTCTVSFSPGRQDTISHGFKMTLTKIFTL